MQATFPVRRVQLRAFILLLAVPIILILGAVGGYWLRSQAEPAVITVAAQQAAPRIASGGLLDRNATAPATTAERASQRSTGIQY